MKQIIKENEYLEALARLEEIIDQVNEMTPTDNPILKELIRISDIIETYEKKHFPIE